MRWGRGWARREKPVGPRARAARGVPPYHPSKAGVVVLLVALEPQPGGGTRTVVVLDPEAFTEPAAWGIVIADLVQHVANAVAGFPLYRAALAAKLRAVIQAEWANPTATAEGEVIRVEEPQAG